MKLLLLLFLIPVLKVSELNQPLYSSISNDTITGKQASYCYMKDTRITTIIRNVNNVDTSEHVYFDNGEVVSWARFVARPVKFTQEELHSVFRKNLTDSEWDCIKGKVGFFLQIWVVADKKGNPVELEFTVRNTDPVFLKMAPDRLFQIEQELEQLLKTEIAEDEHDIKNVKHIVMVSYQDLK